MYLIIRGQKYKIKPNVKISVAFFLLLDDFSSLLRLHAIIIFLTYGHQTPSMPSNKTSKCVYCSPASTARCATWCIACLIRLVGANPTVTNCALLFTLITPLEEVGLCWARPRSTSGSQSSQSSRVATSGVNTDLRCPSRTPRLCCDLSLSTPSAAQSSWTFYWEINAQ